MIIALMTASSGSSNGRGPRCAGWFADYVAERAAREERPPSPEIYTLQGGIKGWVAGGPAYTQFMDGYVPQYWLQFDEVKTAGKRIGSRDNEPEQQGEAAEEGISSTKRTKNE